MPNQINLWDTQRRPFDDQVDTPEYMQQANVYADEADNAYKEALKGIPEEPRPSGWRRAAAAALGAFGGYHQQFVDPRATQAAVQGVLEGDYPMKYRNAQDRVKRAEVGMTMADRLRQRANERYRSESESGARKAAAESLAESRRQAEENKWDASMTARGGIPVDEAELESPAIKAQLAAGTHMIKRGPGGRVLLMPTVAQMLREKQGIQQAASFSPSVYAQIRKVVPGLPENQDFATKSDIDMAKAAYLDMTKGTRQEESLESRERLAALRAARGDRDRDDRIDQKLSAAERTRIERESIGIWNKVKARQAQLDSEARKLDPAVFQGKSTNPIAQKTFNTILEESRRINEEAAIQDASLRGEDIDAYKARNAAHRGKPGDAKAAEPKPAAGASDTVMVKNPQGVTGVIPRSQLAAAKAQGYTEVK